MLKSYPVASTSIILASASPRRRELLGHIVDEFTLESADIDETPNKNESAYDLVERLAEMKAQFVAQKQRVSETGQSGTIIIGSDTVVTQANSILGKPNNYTDFTRMMKMLSDTCHQVYTGVCVVCDNKVLRTVVVTRVTMGVISDQDISEYWASNEPQDKAGGYAIQGIGGKFVKYIEGSFSAVVGLPLYETSQLIQQIQQNQAILASRTTDDE